MNKTKHLFIITTLIICIVWRFIADWLVQNWLAGGCNYHHSSPRDGRLDQKQKKKATNKHKQLISCMSLYKLLLYVIPFESKFLFQSRYMNIMIYIAFVVFFSTTAYMSHNLHSLTARKSI